MKESLRLPPRILKYSISDSHMCPSDNVRISGSSKSDHLSKGDDADSRHDYMTAG